MNPSTFYKYLKVLESMKMIELKSNNKMTTVTISNWGLYQENPTESCQQNDNEITTKEQQNNTNKNVKNVKNVKKYILSPLEDEFLEILSTVEDYPVDMEKDLDMIKRLEERYPQLNLVEAIKDWATYKLDKPLKEKSNARSQINTSFNNY